MRTLLSGWSNLCLVDAYTPSTIPRRRLKNTPSAARGLKRRSCSDKKNQHPAPCSKTHMRARMQKNSLACQTRRNKSQPTFPEPTRAPTDKNTSWHATSCWPRKHTTSHVCT